jgi:hypothetical protein
MKATLAVLADAANRSDNGKLNLLGLFQTIYAASTPAIHSQMYLVLVFKASPGEKGSTQKIKLVLSDEDGGIILASPDYPITVPDDPDVRSPDMNMIINVPNLVLPKFGDYSFEVLLNGSYLTDVSLRVEATAPTSAEAEQASDSP